METCNKFNDHTLENISFLIKNDLDNFDNWPNDLIDHIVNTQSLLLSLLCSKNNENVLMFVSKIMPYLLKKINNDLIKLQNHKMYLENSELIKIIKITHKNFTENIIFDVLTQCTKWLQNDPEFLCKLGMKACKLNSFSLFVAIDELNKCNLVRFRGCLDILVKLKDSDNKIIHYILSIEPLYMFDRSTYYSTGWEFYDKIERCHLSVNKSKSGFTIIDFVCLKCNDIVVNIFLDYLSLIPNYKEKINQHRAIMLCSNIMRGWNEYTLWYLSSLNDDLKLSTKIRLHELEQDEKCNIM